MNRRAGFARPAYDEPELDPAATVARIISHSNCLLEIGAHNAATVREGAEKLLRRLTDSGLTEAQVRPLRDYISAVR